MRYLLTLLLLSLLSAPAAGQNSRTIADDAACDNAYRGDRDGEHFCQVREITLAAGRSVIDIDGGQNGGIRVEGWEGDEILVRAIVVAREGTERAARERVRAVTIETDGKIEADVPRSSSRGRYWTSVSFEVFVPYASNVHLETQNGGIHIAGIAGDVRFDALNGGVKLIDLAGDVRGETTNGGVDIELTGSRWDGEGMDVETTNGGVEIRVPDGYSARLETSTVNGGIRFDFPVKVQGRLDDRVSIDLGDGGPRVRAVTTNGGVRVRRV